jgi:hypothetical protein
MKIRKPNLNPKTRAILKAIATILLPIALQITSLVQSAYQFRAARTKADSVYIYIVSPDWAWDIPRHEICRKFPFQPQNL